MIAAKRQTHLQSEVQRERPEVGLHLGVTAKPAAVSAPALHHVRVKREVRVGHDLTRQVRPKVAIHAAVDAPAGTGGLGFRVRFRLHAAVGALVHRFLGLGIELKLGYMLL